MFPQNSQTTKENTSGNAKSFWEFLDPSGKPPAEARRLVRLNCLGSLYYFIKVGLSRTRLTNTLHYPICLSLEREHVKDVYELPRDHFKSTICSEGLPMWWALPITQQDVDDLKNLAYSDEFINYMLRVHDPNTRILLVSENITNASKLGVRIRRHFESNAFYRTLFPETLPTTQEVWTNTSLHVRRPTVGSSSFHGEGTFDFLGVGSALQSRHYKKLIVDDPVGRKATESVSIMEKTIEYHRLLPGAFESTDKDHENDELGVGNRWGFSDLNSYIRENEPWFRFSTHSALGGCCTLHPSDTPIFPEEFSVKKLLRLKRRLGSYIFSCQFLNNPASPEDAAFKEPWLSYFRLYTDPSGRDVISHDPRPEEIDGYGNRLVVRKNVYPRQFSIGMAVDPAHAGNAAAGRCRHAIIVVAVSPSSDHYILDAWARACSYDTFIAEFYRLAYRWGLREVGLETVAAQRYLKYHLEYRNKIEQHKLRVVELRGEVESPDGTLSHKKSFRIHSIIEPIAENGRLWVQKKHQEFITEYVNFSLIGKNRFVDLLDAFAYIPQLIRVPISEGQQSDWKRANEERSQQVGRRYSMRVA